MPAQPPAKVPEPPASSAAKPAAEKPSVPANRYQADMPQIPGVSSGTPASQSGSGSDSQRLMQIGVIAAVGLLVVGMVVWNLKGKSSNTTAPPAEAQATESTAPAQAPVAAPAPAPAAASNIAATVDQLAKPWDARKFTFFNPLTQEKIPAMIVHLSSGGYWAFSLRAPYGTCELEYVTDLATLASKYRFNAAHPMVVNPCDGTVFDPLKVGPLGGNTWARGEIVQGSSLRPPISIDVKLQGQSIIADGIE
jgi:hypothetical protein